MKRVKITLNSYLYTKNPYAIRQKTAKRFVKYHYSNSNKIDGRPLNSIF